MLRPIACVWAGKTKPCADVTSSKYSSGLTRTSAPVGEFCSHEYALRRTPGGCSDVPAHKLHVIATRSSDAAGAAGSSTRKLKMRVSREIKLRPWFCASRGTDRKSVV